MYKRQLQHGTVTIKYGGQLYETTTFRTEGAYTDGRHPDEVHFVPDEMCIRDRYFALRKANRMRTRLLTEKSQEQLKEVIRYLRREIGRAHV